MADHIYTTDTGREVAFASDESRKAAHEWFYETSKADLIAAYGELMDDGAIFKDENCTQLVDDWDDLVMAAWAHHNVARAPFVWR